MAREISFPNAFMNKNLLIGFFWAAPVPRVFNGVTRGLIQGKNLAERAHWSGLPANTQKKNLRIECNYGCSRLYFKTLNDQKILRKTQKATTY